MPPDKLSAREHLHHWLDISGCQPYDAPMVEVHLSRHSVLCRSTVHPWLQVLLERETNTIQVLSCGSWLRLLLDDRMVQRDMPVTVEVCLFIHHHSVTMSCTHPQVEDTVFEFGVLDSSLAVLTRTLLERGDRNYMFQVRDPSSLVLDCTYIHTDCA